MFKPTKQSTMRGASIAGALTMALILSGCLAYKGGQRETGTPINSENVKKLVKLKSTKTDVIELFGVPTTASGAGQYPAGIPGMPQGNAVLSDGSDQIYVYKHCMSGNPGSAFELTSPTTILFGNMTNTTEERCEQLAVLIGKDEAVRSFGYFPADPVIQENVSKLVKGKSKKVEVIESVGAPTSVSVSGNDEIYSYKICFSSSSVGVFAGATTKDNCKQLTAIMDKNTEVVKAVSFQPLQ